MKINDKILLILILICLIAVLFLYNYVFNVYETVVKKEPDNLFADNHSEITVSVKPVNALGFAAPFRKIPAEFRIEEGRSLIEVIKEDNKSGILRLRAKNGAGKVTIFIKTAYSFLPLMVEINIFPNRV